MNDSEIRELFMQRQKNEQANKVTNFRQLNAFVQRGAVLFTGSSLMEQFPICELCLSSGITKTVYNRGIGGFTTDDFLANIGPMLLDLRPSKLFINIGTNDIRDDPAIPEGWLAHLTANYETILRRLRETLPACEVYLMAYYPVNPDAEVAKNGFMAQALQVRTNQAVARANRHVAMLAEKYHCRYIDANDGLTDEQGRLREEFTVDGVHMRPDAYAVVFRNLKQYI